MDWLRAVVALRESRTPAVLVTVSEVRGHAPRAAGAKLVPVKPLAAGPLSAEPVPA